ncbi:MAG: Ig-like domain-containing protein, partial [Planctomycetota bacterium]
PDNPHFVPARRLETGSLRWAGPPPAVTYAATGLPPGAAFDEGTGIFSWTPGYGDAGTHAVTVTATDDGDGTGTPLSAALTVPITVANLNRRPEIDPIGNVSVERGATLDLPVSASDPDGNPLVLHATSALPGFGLPDFAAFTDNGDGTGGFHFAPGVGDRGDYPITLHATDDGDGGPAPLAAEQSFVVTVLSENDPPVLEYIGDKIAVTGDPFELTIVADDLDQEPLAFSVSGLPPAATLTPGAVYGTAVLTWTPGPADAGDHAATFEVTDGGNGNPALIETDTQTATITVRAANQAPTLDPVADQTVAEDDALSLALTASDPDGDPLTYSGANLPQGAALGRGTGILTWTPGFTQAGTYDGVAVTVGDGHSADTQIFSIEVTNTNRPPRLVPMAVQYGRENRAVVFDVVAGDPDGDPLEYGLDSALPAGATFDTDTGEFDWLPDYEQAGEYPITFTVSDPAGLDDTLDVTVRIGNVNRPPELATSDHAAVLGQPLTFFVTADDADAGTTLTYAADGLPEGAALDADTGEFNWTPGPGQAGAYTVALRVSDGEATTSQAIVIEASLEPDPPAVTVELTPSFPVLPGDPVLVHAIADSLADITALSLTVDGTPTALDEDGRAQIVAGQPGKTTIEATATDADGLVGATAVVLKVRDPLDDAPPHVALDGGLAGQVVDGPVDIVGTVADLSLDVWRLGIAELGSGEFIELAAGGQPVDSAVLAELDPSQLRNGFYRLRLAAADIDDRTAEVTARVEINATTRPDAYRRTETDLSVPLGAATAEIVRTYDSSARHAPGAFGYGWRLANVETDVQTDVPLTGHEELGLYEPFREGTRLFLTAPSGERIGFTFAPQRVELPGLVYHVPGWQADPGAAHTLASAEALLTRAGARFYDQATGQPYNLASPFFDGIDYTLTAPDGTQYLIGTEEGIVEQVAPGGARLIYSGSGIVAPGGESVQFVWDGAGRLERAVAPGGVTIVYEYDEQGDLSSVRNLASGEVARYGYDPVGDHRLTAAVGPSAADEVVFYGRPVATAPILADLGLVEDFTGGATAGSLAAGATDRYAFSLQTDELAGMSSGRVLMRVAVEATGPGLEPGGPTVAGLTAVSTELAADRAVGLFLIDRAGLYVVSVVGADASAAGAYELSVGVAGDVNTDGLVDGTDSALVASALGTAQGDPGYVAAADLDGSGAVDATDVQVLVSNFGFIAEPAASIAATTAGAGGPAGYAYDPWAPLELTAPAEPQRVQRGRTCRVEWIGGGTDTTFDLWRVGPDGEALVAAGLSSTLGGYEWDTTGVSEGRYRFFVRTAASHVDGRTASVEVVAAPVAGAPLAAADGLVIAPEPGPAPGHAPVHASAVGITNGSFLIDDPGDPGFGWQTFGEAGVADGAAELDEGEDRFTALMQTFVVPAGTLALRFELVTAALGHTEGDPPDAFEAALFDPATRSPLAGTVDGLADSDAFLNVQALGRTYAGSTVSFPGQPGPVDVIDLAGGVTVELDLTGVPAGALATLRFDLLGFGENEARVVLDNVRLIGTLPARPTAVDDDAVTYEGVPVAVDVLANDEDLDGALDATTVVVTSGPSNGEAEVEASTGVVTYTPTPGFAGDDAFTYTVHDADGLVSNEATVAVSVLVPLRVTELIVNGGAEQRSNVETVALVFADDTNLQALIDSGQIGEAVRVADLGAGQPVPLQIARYRYDAAARTLTMDVTEDGYGGSRKTLLGDGRYEVTLDTAVIGTPAGAVLAD